MSSEFRRAFDAEVEAHGFRRGARSFIVAGPTATIDCTALFACLCRAHEKAVMLDVHTLLRRIDERWIPQWTPEDDEILNEAECVIIHGLLDQETLDTYTPSQRKDLSWFVETMVKNGVVTVISHEQSDADLDVLGVPFGNFIEQNFEVLHVTSPAETKEKIKKRTGSKRKHRRDAGTSKSA